MLTVSSRKQQAQLKAKGCGPTAHRSGRAQSQILELVRQAAAWEGTVCGCCLHFNASTNRRVAGAGVLQIQTFPTCASSSTAAHLYESAVLDD